MVALTSLVSCSNTETQGGADETSKPEGYAGIDVEEGLLNMTVTLPKNFFAEQTSEEIMASADENGFSKCVVHGDGSVTYTMTKKKHAEVLENLYQGTMDLAESYTVGEEAVPSFVSIEINDDLSVIDIFVDNEVYTVFDKFYGLAFCMTSAAYQTYSGTNFEDVDVTLNFINNETKEILDTSNYKDMMNNNSSTSTEDSDFESNMKTAQSISLGDTISIPDNCEFFVEFHNITNDVQPPTPSDWHSHYEAETGKTYLDICVGYKNLLPTEVGADDVISGQLIYGGKYVYSGFSTIEEDNRGDFTYSNITSISPLSTEYLHYLFLLPESIANSDGSLSVLLNINGSYYNIMVREGNDVNVQSNAQAKANGQVSQGETIAVAGNSEFFVDYANITNDVVPPNPDSWYTHYEAESGKTYVDFCLAYKNLNANRVGAGKVISATLTYDGKYDYTGFSCIEEGGRSDFTYSNITSIAPLTTEYLHYLFEVPEEVGTSTNSLLVNFEIGGNSYSYAIR